MATKDPINDSIRVVVLPRVQKGKRDPIQFWAMAECSMCNHLLSRKSSWISQDAANEAARVSASRTVCQNCPGHEFTPGTFDAVAYGTFRSGQAAFIRGIEGSQGQVA
jgi:hypothetical protein